jgi:hypothetical protein
VITVAFSPFTIGAQYQQSIVDENAALTLTAHNFLKK